MKLDIHVYFISVAGVLIGGSCDPDLFGDRISGSRYQSSMDKVNGMLNSNRISFFGQNSVSDWVDNFLSSTTPRVTDIVPRLPSPGSTSTSTTVNGQSITTKPPFWLTTESPASGCILPEQPIGGNYEVVNRCAGSCSNAPGTRVPVGSFLTYSCQNGWALKGNNASFCSLAGWHISPTCVKMCDGLQSDSVDIACSYQGENVFCGEKMMPGTEATFNCKSFHKIPLTNNHIYKTIYCFENGIWDRPLLRCIPECGKESDSGVSLIVNGFTAKHGVFPWHVAIYENHNTSSPEQICAGSLISSKFVISAAHCFYDDTSRTKRDASNFTIAVGKYYRPYNWPELTVQKSAVRKIDLSTRYLGIIGNYAADIALIHVETPFNLTSWVRPICVDWDNRNENNNLQIDSVGKAVGWGRRADGNFSLELQEINLPYVAYDQCISAVPPDFIGFVTPDKFCAGYLNGSSLCNGDSGGGLGFQNNGLWYLRGIISTSPTNQSVCNNNFYTAFTDIGRFTEWIQYIFMASE